MSSENIPETLKRDRLLTTLQRLLKLSATSVGEALHETSQLVTQALGAEKVDVFLYDAQSQSLIAFGTSMTPMGSKEKEIGLDRLPLSNGGRVVEVYLTGQSYWTGQAHRDPHELTGMTEDLGIQSEIIVPLYVDDQRRGTLLASSSGPHFFTEQDLRFLEAVTDWVGTVIHRAELLEQYTNEAREKARQGAAEELLTMMAHDLLNYLTPLKGRIDLLERRARREKQPSYVQELETVKQTLERLNRLVSSLLDVARLKKGIFSLDLQSVDLVDLLEELVSIWRTELHPIQVQAPEELIIMADRDRIQQVLENLLSNATTYADAFTPIQVLIAKVQRGDTSWATVTISNQGPDIPPDLFASLFHPFVKGVHSRGLGLGLSLAERIARAHQGTLTVSTGSEQTTHFTLSLPLVQTKGPPAKTEA